MIRSPRIGQHVQVWYRASKRGVATYHGRVGTVVVVGRGPGPRNHGVLVGGDLVIVPAGNLRGTCNRR